MTARGQATSHPPSQCPSTVRSPTVDASLFSLPLSPSSSLFKTTQEQHTHHTQSKDTLPSFPTTSPNLLTSAHDYLALTAAIDQHVYHH